MIRKEILSSAAEDNNGTVNSSNDGVGVKINVNFLREREEIHLHLFLDQLLIHHSMEYPGLNTNMYVLQPGHNLEVIILN